MSKNSFFGLSLSDRLNKGSVTDSFANAVNSRNASQMTKILRGVDYSSSSTKATVDTFLNNPKAFKR